MNNPATSIESEVTPTVAAVAAALSACAAAHTQRVLLTPRASLNPGALDGAAQRGGEVAVAMQAYLDARKQLADVLNAQVESAEQAQAAVVWQFLARLFGTSMPGPVTLPSDCGLHPITENVCGLTSVSERRGEISGVLWTCSHYGSGPVSYGSRSFFTRNGKLYFSEHVSL